MRGSWSNEFRSLTTSNNLAWKTLSHFLLNLFVQLRLHFLRNASVILTVTLESTLLMFYHRQCQNLLIFRDPISYHQLREWILLPDHYLHFKNSSIIAKNSITRKLKTIIPSPIILIHSLCSEIALNKATNSKSSSFIWFLSFFTHMTFRSLALTSFLLRFHSFILFHKTMPKSQKLYPNSIWHVLPEGHGLNFESTLLTIVYWNLATHIVRVRVSFKFPINRNLYVTKKCNVQIHIGSKAMLNLYELLCHHSITCSDPLFEEFLSYLPTRIPSQVSYCIAYESSDNESVRSIDSSTSAFYSDDST